MVLDVSRVGGSNARAASGAFHCSSASLPDVSDEEHGRPGWDAGWRLAYGQGLRFGGSLPLAVAILACFVYSLAFDRISCTMLFCRKTVFYNNYGNACSANVQRGSRSPAAACWAPVSVVLRTQAEGEAQLHSTHAEVAPRPRVYAVPSISTVTGDSTPQRYFWRVGVALTMVGHLPHGVLLHFV